MPSEPNRADLLNLALMLVLTFSTGVIDAVGYLGLDRVFTGNMTGNVVLLGVGLTGTTDLPVLRPILALAAFCVGAVVAGRLLRGHAGHWSTRMTGVFATVTVILAGTGAALVTVGDPGHEPWTGIATGASALAMGMQAAAARVLKVADVTTVVVTSTLTGLAADSRLAGGAGANWVRRVLAIVLIGAGAGAGAGALLAHVSAGLLLAAALTAGVSIAGLVGHHRIARPTTADAVAD